jgi:hypothetical protein
MTTLRGPSDEETRADATLNMTAEQHLRAAARISHSSDVRRHGNSEDRNRQVQQHLSMATVKHLATISDQLAQLLNRQPPTQPTTQDQES